jgi:hypothetical protein
LADHNLLSGRLHCAAAGFLITVGNSYFKETHMTNERVTGLVWKDIEGVPFILILVPAKSISPADHSVTTVSGTLLPLETGFSGITRILQEYLGISRGNVLVERSMRNSMESRGKTYTWYFLKVKEDTKIAPCADEVKDYEWNPPSLLLQSIENMRAGRRYMFIQALNEACNQSLIDRKHFPFLDEMVSVAAHN